MELVLSQRVASECFVHIPNLINPDQDSLMNWECIFIRCLNISSRMSFFYLSQEKKMKLQSPRDGPLGIPVKDYSDYFSWCGKTRPRWAPSFPDKKREGTNEQRHAFTLLCSLFVAVMWPADSRCLDFLTMMDWTLNCELKWTLFPLSCFYLSILS